MKKLRIHTLFLQIVLAVTAVCLSACDDDSSNLSVINPDIANNGINKNANDASKNPLLSQLQFPKVKGGNSEVISHSTADLDLNYSIEWDHTLRAQRWTCYTFNASNSIKKWSRSNWKSTTWGGDPFQFDPKVPIAEQPPVTGEFWSSHYPGTNQGYDRGHICASEDRVCSQQANEQTFYMTNMMPQVNSFNANLWAQMEIAVRDKWNKSNFRDVLYVVKGGTIDKESQILDRTRSGFIVPRYFFMAVLCKNDNTYKALAFWVEHLNEDHSSDPLTNYVINVDRLEQLTGIDFFCNLPDDLEEQIESTNRSKIIEQWF